MPDDFDYDFLCNAFDVIFDTEYHSLVQKSLTIIYNFAPFFHNNARQAIFMRLFTKHFFSLFLHWEIAIRNTFQQILVFRVLKSKRTTLAQNGLLIAELGVAKRAPPPSLALPSVPENSADDDTLSVDSVLFAKIQSYLQMCEEQLRNPKLGIYEQRHQIYVPVALMEYKTYLSFYYQWEGTGQPIPKLIPHNLIRERVQMM